MTMHTYVRTDVRTDRRTYRQKLPLNRLVWGSLSLAPITAHTSRDAGVIISKKTNQQRNSIHYIIDLSIYGVPEQSKITDNCSTETILMIISLNILMSNISLNPDWVYANRLESWNTVLTACEGLNRAWERRVDDRDIIKLNKLGRQAVRCKIPV